MAMRLVLISCAVLALAACHKQHSQPTANEGAPTVQAGPHKGVDRSHEGTPAPGVSFNDPEGGKTTLASHLGKPTLVNLWATWCAPCVKELPTLGRLAKAHEKDSTLQVLAISQDSGPHASVVAFLKSKAPELAPYQDPAMALSGKLDAEVLPTSILFDAQGHEVWRYVGDLDWTSPEAAKLLAEANAPKAH
jgi:thiol-disulfide isomerase/thioredoxin